MITSGLSTVGESPMKANQTEKSASISRATYSSVAVAAKGAQSEDVVTISKSMEKLLDGFTGAGKKSAAGGGSSGFTSAALDRARQAQQVMQGLAGAKSAFADSLGKALDSLKGTLGNTLSQFGMPKDKIATAVDGFGKDLQDKMKSFDFSELAVDYQQSQSQFTIESHGIDLIIQDGDRELKISYAKSTLEFQRDDVSLQAQFGQGGQGAVQLGASTLTADGKAEGMIINAKGFTAEEVEAVLSQLNELQSGGGGAAGGASGGLAVLTPEKKQNGILRLKLDLSAVLPAASASAGAAAANSTNAKTVDLTA